VVALCVSRSRIWSTCPAPLRQVGAASAWIPRGSSVGAQPLFGFGQEGGMRRHSLDQHRPPQQG
jgi:hypothetical protein